MQSISFGPCHIQIQQCQCRALNRLQPNQPRRQYVERHHILSRQARVFPHKAEANNVEGLKEEARKVYKNVALYNGQLQEQH
jgi:hypothetical protein